MSIFKKNGDGVLKRFEYRGKNIRVSRTGGIALRTHIKVKGVNVSLNTAHGVRVSTKLAKGTQIGLQGGRFYIRGRYGDGPTKLNLSKTGVTVSTSNKYGSINWVKPGRSSFRMAGINVRGRKAYEYQVLYIVYATFMFLIKSLFKAVFYVANFLVRVIFYVFRLFARMIIKFLKLVGFGALFKHSRYFSSDISEVYGVDDASDATFLLWAFHLRLSGLDFEQVLSMRLSTTFDDGNLLKNDSFQKMLKLVFDKSIEVVRMDYERICRVYYKNFGSDALLGVLLDMDDSFCKYNARTNLQEEAIVKSLKNAGVEIEFTEGK